ncbi:MAG: hypothetical protein DME23_11255 [Verrucomicrobia bacterium]|nr:MAG: hypothetical protein DME23_11255 [Verrucomicrobiota bacterium]
MKKILLPLIAVGLLAGRQTLLAATEDFTISLDAPQEGDPADTSAASGSGTLTLDTAANTLTFNNIIWSGLESDSTVSHIHGPAAAGVNANPIYFLSQPHLFFKCAGNLYNDRSRHQKRDDIGHLDVDRPPRCGSCLFDCQPDLGPGRRSLVYQHPLECFPQW